MAKTKRKTQATGDTAPRVPCAVVMVGLMGAGKSCIGRHLARHLGLAFVDADSEIEAAAGCSIAEIFRTRGEEEFRQGERRVLARLLKGPKQVIATGGGAFMNDRTRETIKEKAISVWLRADLEILVKRTSRRSHRPLLSKGDPRAILTALIDERYPVYAQADITVDTTDAPAEETVERVLAALASHLGARQGREGTPVPPGRAAAQ